MTTFNYDYYQIAVSIYQYADFSVNAPHNLEYATARLNDALDTKINWLPVYETYKGASQKRKGTATVKVEMCDGTSYGFSMHTYLADKVHAVLRAKWMEIYGS